MAVDKITEMAARRAEQYAREHPDDPEAWQRKSVDQLIQEALEELADADNYIRWALTQLYEELSSGDAGAQRHLAIMARFLRAARWDSKVAFGWLQQGLWEVKNG